MYLPPSAEALNNRQ